MFRVRRWLRNKYPWSTEKKVILLLLELNLAKQVLRWRDSWHLRRLRDQDKELTLMSLAHQLHNLTLHESKFRGKSKLWLGKTSVQPQDVKAKGAVSRRGSRHHHANLSQCLRDLKAAKDAWFQNPSTRTSLFQTIANVAKRRRATPTTRINLTNDFYLFKY